MSSWLPSLKRTGRLPHHRRIQEAYAPRLVLSVWFPPPAISKTWYFRVPLRARHIYRNKTLLLLSLMATLVNSGRKSPRPENRGPVLSPRSSLLGFYPRSKVYAQYHNTPLLPPNNLHKHCFRFPLGHLHVPGEVANNVYANFWRVKEVYHGICASRESEQPPRCLQQQDTRAVF